MNELAVDGYHGWEQMYDALVGSNEQLIKIGNDCFRILLEAIVSYFIGTNEK